MTRNLLIGIAAVGVISATTTVSALARTAHARTTTAVQASLNYCSHQTGGQRKTAPAFQQCMATLSGNGGYCSPNQFETPYWTGRNARRAYQRAY